MLTAEIILGMLENNKNKIGQYGVKRIGLFGSYCKNEQKKESDIDILVIVKESSLPRYKRSIPLYKELSGILIPKDLLVYTEDEIDEWSEVPQSFITTICKKGRVIYEKDTN